MFTPETNIFAKKENVEMNFALRRNAKAAADAVNPFIYETVIKNGPNKGNKMRYYTMDLEPLKRISERTGRETFFSTTKDSLAYAVTEFKKRMYNEVRNALKESIDSKYAEGSAFDKDGKCSFPVFGCVHTYPTPWPYTVILKDGRKIERNTITFITLEDELDEAPKIYARMMKEAERTRIINVVEAQAQADAAVNLEVNNSTDLDAPKDENEEF